MKKAANVSSPAVKQLMMKIKKTALSLETMLEKLKKLQKKEKATAAKKPKKAKTKAKAKGRPRKAKK